MRFSFFCIVFLATACTPSEPQKATQKVVNTATADSIIASIDVALPQPIDSLDMINVAQLIESLAQIPFEQRQVTLQSIKKEANTFLDQKWPKALDIKPIRSRYMVFVTDAHIAADKRLGRHAAEEQAKIIVKMKKSWNIFVRQLKRQESSAVLEMTPREMISKSK